MKNKTTDFQHLVSSRPSGWKAKAAERLKDKELKRDQMEVCLLVLEELSKRKMTQATLAERMGVSAQYVNQMLKGNENFTFQTIHKIQNALGFKIMCIQRFQQVADMTSAVEMVTGQVVAVASVNQQMKDTLTKHMQACISINVESDAQQIAEQPFCLT
eukprot:TRINITY_DN2562_c0_g2_i1.p3 TRINITY_DN2562_c0_g2~~TRINITY_DN2562_c0_g2_i1.p3  ORF type:complete len:159 (+),score=3.87 TRINITY_DN2562_c0_g2_i1:1210-1686(+)